MTSHLGILKKNFMLTQLIMKLIFLINVTVLTLMSRIKNKTGFNDSFTSNFFDNYVQASFQAQLS